MDRAGAQRLNGGQVLGRAVAFVLGKTVAGIEPVKLAHEAVARHLRQDARAGNGVAARIAFHQRRVREAHGLDGAPIHQHMLGRRLQLVERQVHRAMRRLVEC